MPEQYAYGLSHIVVFGKKELTVDFVKMVMEYSDFCVRLLLKQGQLEICGSSLLIDQYSENNVVIKGKIESITLK